MWLRKFINPVSEFCFASTNKRFPPPPTIVFLLHQQSFSSSTNNRFPPPPFPTPDCRRAFGPPSSPQRWRYLSRRRRRRRRRQWYSLPTEDLGVGRQSCSLRTQRGAEVHRAEGKSRFYSSILLWMKWIYCVSCELWGIQFFDFTSFQGYCKWICWVSCEGYCHDSLCTVYTESIYRLRASVPKEWLGQKCSKKQIHLCKFEMKVVLQTICLS